MPTRLNAVRACYFVVLNLLNAVKIGCDVLFIGAGGGETALLHVDFQIVGIANQCAALAKDFVVFANGVVFNNTRFPATQNPSLTDFTVFEEFFIAFNAFENKHKSLAAGYFYSKSSFSST